MILCQVLLRFSSDQINFREFKLTKCIQPSFFARRFLHLLSQIDVVAKVVTGNLLGRVVGGGGFSVPFLSLLSLPFLHFPSSATPRCGASNPGQLSLLSFSGR